MRPITTGTENFKELIDKGFYYVDKSSFIESSFSDKVMLFTRPRRFGKTLNMSMLYYFYSNKEKENAYLFDHLEISRNQEIMKYQNQYPVIFLTMKDLKSNDYSSFIESYKILISQTFYKFLELENSDKLDNFEKNIFQSLKEMRGSDTLLQKALLYLSQLLEKYYDKKVVILIDEYDVPLQAAHQHHYYEKMTDFMSLVFSSTLKTNESLEKGILTGCLRIAKESIFTGLNNFSVYSIFNKGKTSEQFGFTQQEINEILKDYALTNYQRKIKEWYDGYLFGNTEIYNPWSVLKYIKQIKDEQDDLPQSYWANTSGNQIVYDYIQDSDETMKEEFEQLIHRKSIIKTIHPELTYREMDDIENIYAFLLFTGYLKVKQQISQNEYELVIPNQEVFQIYEQSFIKYFNEYTRNRKKELYQLFVDKKVNEANLLLNDILNKSISYYDNQENFYHGFLVGLFSYMEIESNKEAGNGRFDIAILPRNILGTAIVIECKHSSSDDHLIADSKLGAKQIIDKKYLEDPKFQKYQNVIGYGIAFYKKQCFITLCQSL